MVLHAIDIKMSSLNAFYASGQDSRNGSTARERNTDEVAPLKPIRSNLEAEESRPLTNVTNAATRPIESQGKNDGRRVSGAYKNSNQLEKGQKRGG